VQVVGVLGQVGAGWVLGEALDQSRFETDGGCRSGEVVCRAALQIDPEELAFTDALAQAGLQLDLAILSICVIEADSRPSLAVGDRDQWRTARRIATTAATNAVAYCNTSIDRSTGPMAGPSITPPWGITV
jgi:hypothetical protein